MDPFRNGAWGKHFIGGNRNLDHGLIYRSVGIMILDCGNDWVVNLHRRDDLPPMKIKIPRGAKPRPYRMRPPYRAFQGLSRVDS